MRGVVWIVCTVFLFFILQMRRSLLLCEYISSLIKYCTKYGYFWRVHSGPSCPMQFRYHGSVSVLRKGWFPELIFIPSRVRFKFHKHFWSLSKCKVERKHSSRLPYLQRQKFNLEARYLLICHAFVFGPSYGVICICRTVNSFVWFSKYFVGILLRKNICMTFKVICFGVTFACCVNTLHT